MDPQERAPKEIIETAVEHASTLAAALQYIIKLRNQTEGDQPGEPILLPKPPLDDIEAIVTKSRLDRFWEKWTALELEETPEAGYFTSHIQPSPQEYDSKNYQQKFFKLVSELEAIKKMVGSLDWEGEQFFRLPVLLDAVSNCLGALTALHFQIIEDGGEHALKHLEEMQSSEQKATVVAAQKAFRIDGKEEVLGRMGARSVNGYIEGENNAVDREKDVLQVLLAQIGENLTDIRKAVGPSVINGNIPLSRPVVEK